MEQNMDYFVKLEQELEKMSQQELLIYCKHMMYNYEIMRQVKENKLDLVEDYARMSREILDYQDKIRSLNSQLKVLQKFSNQPMRIFNIVSGISKDFKYIEFVHYETTAETIFFILADSDILLRTTDKNQAKELYNSLEERQLTHD